jgi:hypothetical protein
VAAALARQGPKVVSSLDEFGAGVSDERLLGEDGRRGWVFLTADDRIRYRQGARNAAHRHGAAVFVFKGKELTADQIAAGLVKALPKMEKMARSEPRPFIARITRSGDVAPLLRAGDAGW